MRNLNNILKLIKEEDPYFSSYKSFEERSIFHDFPFYLHNEKEWDQFVISLDLLKNRIYFYLRSHLEIKKINDLIPILNVTEWENNLFVYHISKLTDKEVAKLYILLVKMIEKTLNNHNLIDTEQVDEVTKI